LESSIGGVDTDVVSWRRDDVSRLCAPTLAGGSTAKEGMGRLGRMMVFLFSLLIHIFVIFCTVLFVLFRLCVEESLFCVADVVDCCRVSLSGAVSGGLVVGDEGELGVFCWGTSSEGVTADPSGEESSRGNVLSSSFSGELLWTAHASGSASPSAASCSSLLCDGLC